MIASKTVWIAVVDGLVSGCIDGRSHSLIEVFSSAADWSAYMDMLSTYYMGEGKKMNPYAHVWGQQLVLHEGPYNPDLQVPRTF